MSGGSRNQVEFAEDLGSFFGPVVSSQRILTVQTHNQTFQGCTFTPKTTTFGVDIWRLSLPTAAKTGLEYPGSIIHFTRTASPTYFRLAVAPDGSQQAMSWEQHAVAGGKVSSTSGARRYGIY